MWFKVNQVGVLSLIFKRDVQRLLRTGDGEFKDKIKC